MSDLTMFRGDTFEFDLTFTGIASLSGTTLKVQMRKPDDSVLFEKTLDDGIVDISEGETVAARVTIEPADTAALTHQTVLLWDAELTTGGKTYTVDSGRLTIKPDVTRA